MPGKDLARKRDDDNTSLVDLFDDSWEVCSGLFYLSVLALISTRLRTVMNVQSPAVLNLIDTVKLTAYIVGL